MSLRSFLFSLQQHRYVLFFAAAIFLSSANAQHPLDAAAGKALFDRSWVSAPASTAASDGLGPFYNARSCNACHPDGGRGQDVSAFTFRIDDERYGRQLQPNSIQGLLPEAKLNANYSPLKVELDDGTVFDAQTLSLELQGLRYGELESAWSARMAPSLLGIAALAQVSTSTLELLADPDDANADGISGRVVLVDAGNGSQGVGRFGWKSEQANLPMQIAQAFSHDIGLSSSLFPSHFGDCTQVQEDCWLQVPGTQTGTSTYELTDEILDLVLVYLQALPIPSSGPLDSGGLVLFQELGCAACHLPSLSSELGDLHAFTDLLLHDMGSGLADSTDTGDILASEWRTAALWALSGNSRFLHDGRARSPEEAILWHAGEALRARQAYLSLNEGQKQRLIAFLFAL